MTQIIVPFVKSNKSEDGIVRVSAQCILDDGSKIDVADVERYFDNSVNKDVYRVSNIRNPMSPPGSIEEIDGLSSTTDILWAITRMQEGVPLDNKLIKCFVSKNKCQRIDIFENSDATFSIQTHLRTENGSMSKGINRPGIKDVVTLNQELSDIMTESEITEGIIFNEFKIKDRTYSNDSLSA